MTVLDAPSTGSPPTIATEPAPTPRRPSAGIGRLRITAIAVAVAVVGAASGGIFDSAEWTLVTAPVLPVVVAMVVVTRRATIRIAGAVVSTVAAVAATVGFEAGSPGDVADAFTSGVQGLLSTEWPSPLRPDLLGTVVAATATAGALGAELAGRRRYHLMPLLPVLAVYLGAVALSAPSGVDWAPLAGLATIFTVFATLRHDGTVAERLTLLRGERRLLPLVLIAAVTAGSISLPLELSPRADPRQPEAAERTAPLLDPVEATIALRAIEPAVTLHAVTGSTDTALPSRWRTAALEDYDGQRWSPDLTLRPLGRTLGPAGEEAASASISFLDDDLTLVPFPGRPVSVDTAVETDADRTVVRLAERVEVGDRVSLTWNPAAGAADAAAVGIAAREIDDEVSGLTELARSLAGDGSPLEQLRQLEATMRADFALDSDVQGGGLQRALVDRFLRDTRRGTTEQFATGFVLLARSLGIDARVATGFATDATTVGSLALRSSDATTWPEILLLDGRWLALDPVPEEEVSDAAPIPPEPQVQSPAAPQPPIAPPPDPADDSTEPEQTGGDDTSGSLETALRWAAGAGVVGSMIALPFLVAALVILGLKRRRRRRRLTAPSPIERIRGAWANATDVLVDGGLVIAPSDTDTDIALHGTRVATSAHHELTQLAVLSRAATFGTPRAAERLADTAQTHFEALDGAMSTERTRWQRLRWRLSLRSLRAATRSPVDDVAS